MGSLSLAGAIGGVGKAMQSNVEHSRTMEREDLDRDHDLTMERMRSQSYATAATTRSQHELGMAGTRSEHELGMADIASTERTDAADLANTRAVDLQAASITSAESMNEADNRSLELREVMKMFNEQNKSGSISWKGWDFAQNKIAASMDMETGQQIPPRVETIMTMQSGPMMGSYISKADMLFRSGGSGAPLKQMTVEERRKEEGVLMNNLGDHKAEQAFYDEFGYFPMTYAAAMQAQGSKDFKSFARTMGHSFDLENGEWVTTPNDAGGGKGPSATTTGALTDAANTKPTTPYSGPSIQDMRRVGVTAPPPPVTAAQGAQASHGAAPPALPSRVSDMSRDELMNSLGSALEQ